MPPSTMTQSKLVYQSNPMTMREIAYSDACKHYWKMFNWVITNLNRVDLPMADRYWIIMVMGQMQMQLHEIRVAGVLMAIRDPNCHIVRGEPAGYFASGFEGRCLILLRALYCLTKQLMNSNTFQRDQEVWQTLTMLAQGRHERWSWWV